MHTPYSPSRIAPRAFTYAGPREPSISPGCVIVICVAVVTFVCALAFTYAAGIALDTARTCIERGQPAPGQPFRDLRCYHIAP